MSVILVRPKEVEADILEADILAHLHFLSMLLFFSFKASVSILVVFLLFIVSAVFLSALY